MCGKKFKSSAYWFLMKKSEFPDTCCACRLADRERMRAELQGIELSIDDSKGPQLQFTLETKVARGKHGRGFKKIVTASSTQQAEAAQKKEKPKKLMFYQMMKEADLNFPELADNSSKEGDENCK